MKASGAKRASWLGGVFLLACALACPAQYADIVSIGSPETPQVRFAKRDLAAALQGQRFFVHQGAAKLPLKVGTRNFRVRLHDASSPVTLSAATPEMRKGIATIQPEGFIITRADLEDEIQVSIVSIDTAGAMYGTFELAEQVRTRGVEGVVTTARNPYLRLRGTKFNLPLDLRTPSYSDMSDAAQANIPTVWDFDFWRDYLDQLARDRYNFVSLWNLHPFPSMVKVPEFPDVALADVWRTKAPLAEDYTTRTTDLLSPQMLANKEVVKRLTIGQKIDFWRRVMQHAHDRNIAIHVVTWNIYTYGVDGKYGITDSLENPKTTEYFRASVREMFRTYPLLAGIGLTAGENMGEVKMYFGGVDSFDAKENWLLATYGQGVLDAARAEPQRPFRLIHRQHESRAQDIASTFKPLIEQPNVDFVFSFKYAQAHALSSTTQTFHRDYLPTLGAQKTLWTIRNDDALMLRWAAPGFVREFVRNIPHEPSLGYYVGSDMWIWGREFLANKPRHTFRNGPRILESDKHWLHTLLWGRMGFDPTLDDARLAQLVGLRFRGVDGAKLLSAWQDASMVYPLVTGFHWANFDFQWYIEGCRSRPGPAKTASGFHSVETFINQPVHPGTDNIPIPKFVAGETQGTSPLQVAATLDDRADTAILGAAAIANARAARNAELAETLDDIRAMALLGKYYAAKIRGATALARFRHSGESAQQQEAIRQLHQAEGWWLKYTQNMGSRYRNPLWTNRVGIVDWQELNAEVRNDIALARAPGGGF